MTANSINISILEYLIITFNKEVSIKDIEASLDIEDFIKYNSEYLFQMIASILYYLEQYSSLNKLNLVKCNLLSNNLYNDVLIDSILESDNSQKSLENDILYTKKTSTRTSIRTS